jgi:squalene-hopene/tetraprenyl-beta-curcumene cyclase
MSEGFIAPHSQTGTATRLERQAAPPKPAAEDLAHQAIRRATDYLLSLQAPEGYWWAELEADTTLSSDYILYLHVLGRLESPKVAKLANHIRRRQNEDGGWPIYQGGPAELNATVKAYFGLRLAGDSVDEQHMAAARKRIHELGGLEAANSYTRFYLALVNAIGWELVPAIPPELMLLPKWFPVNLYEMSSWTRGIVVPLMILHTRRQQWPVDEGARVDELFRDPARKAAAFEWDKKLFSWRNLFLAVDRAYKLYDRSPWKPFRRRAVAAARQWMMEHLERSDGLSTIYPAMMNSIFVLMALGLPPDDPITAREIAKLASYEIEEGDELRVQPCISPVWDTAIAMVSLAEAGLDPSHPSLLAAARWLLDNQILGPGDWQRKNPDAEPGGWAFEFKNDFFPDVDDTAFVLMALQRVAYPDRGRMEPAVRRGLSWMLSMQNRDGGWASFDRDNNRSLLTHIPFADHNAMIDPSTPDLTARVLECLGQFAFPANHPAVKRGLEYLGREQMPEGAWYGRWGVNYIYGTSGVLRALETFGLSQNADCQRAAAWLRSVQNPDGGFGETIASYDDPSIKGKGKSTASQTAWALIGLLAVAGPGDSAVERAVAYLTQSQNADGSWDEAEFTGTGFPRVFYLKYHLYRNSFPLYALARYRSMRRGAAEFRATRFEPQQFVHRNGNGVNA